MTVELSFGVVLSLVGIFMAFLVNFVTFVALFVRVLYKADAVSLALKEFKEEMKDTLGDWKLEFQRERQEMIKDLRRHSDVLSGLITKVAVLEEKENGSGGFRREGGT